jgi:hypothetical protein
VGCAGSGEGGAGPICCGSPEPELMQVCGVPSAVPSTVPSLSSQLLLPWAQLLPCPLAASESNAPPPQPLPLVLELAQAQP